MSLLVTQSVSQSFSRSSSVKCSGSGGPARQVARVISICQHRRQFSLASARKRQKERFIISDLWWEWEGEKSNKILFGLSPPQSNNFWYFSNRKNCIRLKGSWLNDFPLNFYKKVAHSYPSHKTPGDVSPTTRGAAAPLLSSTWRIFIYSLATAWATPQSGAQGRKQGIHTVSHVAGRRFDDGSQSIQVNNNR